MRQSSVKRDSIITFGISFVLFVYEVFLSRFFSAILAYNFVFIAISLATLGAGFGGYVAYRSGVAIYRACYLWLGMFAFAMLSAVFMMYILPFRGMWFYTVAAFPPFLIGGALIAAILQANYRQLHVVYFSDLVGAGLGAVCSVWFMNILDPVQTIFLLGTVVLLISFVLIVKHSSLRLKIIYILVLIIAIYNIIEPYNKEMIFRAFTTSPNHVFNNRSGVKSVFSDWNSLAKTDVYDAGDGELLYITIDGGAVSPISKYTGNLKQVDYLTGTTSYLAFQDILKERALIIGAGGGQEVLTAQIAGFKQIDAVDINEGSFKAVQKMSHFSGDVFHQKGVSAFVSDGRTFIRQTKNQYDVIYLSLVKKESENGLGIALTENYLFTQEAIEEYIKKLNPGGRLAFLLHDEAEMLKVENAAEKVLQARGVQESKTHEHMAVIGTYHHLGHIVWGMNKTVITRPLLIISQNPFTEQNARQLKTEAENIQQIPLHVPFIADRLSTIKDYLKKDNLDLLSNQDDKPFFYQKSKGVPNSLLWLLACVFVISLLFIRKKRLPYGSIVYISGIGIGFMIIETTLIQRLILPLGHPIYAFVLVLSVLLVSGGIGSMVSSHWSSSRSRRFSPLLWVAVLTIGLNLLISWYQKEMIYLPLLIRLMLGVIVLVPLGFFMGMPFPFGLSLLSKRQVSISWAINGLMTIAGSLLAVLISINLGFTATLVIGASVYGLLYLFQPRLNMEG